MYKFSCLIAINPHYLSENKKITGQCFRSFLSFTKECGTFPLNRLSGAIVLVSPKSAPTAEKNYDIKKGIVL